MSEVTTDNWGTDIENVSRLEDISPTSTQFNQVSKSKDRHLQKSCPVCFKCMKSDKINRHLKTHDKIKSKYIMNSCTICGKSMRRDNLKRHLKTHDKLHFPQTKSVNNDTPSLSVENINQMGKECQDIFNEKLKTGSLVKKMLLDTDIDPQCLSNDLKEPLHLYEGQSNFDVNNTTLKLWQQEVLNLIEKPSDREIIWIIGQRGNEGKTWIQKYIEQHFGKRRVFKTCIVKDPASLLHILSKRTLSCTDIFLLNIPRSFDISDVPYTVLEDIKDGQASSCKYNSKMLNIYTPNVLIIFSNYWPLTNKLSNDRLKLYSIAKTEKLLPLNNPERSLTIKEMKRFRKNINSSKQDSDED